jgi:hypothetical protein
MILKRIHKIIFNLIWINPIKSTNVCILLSTIYYLIIGDSNIWVKKKLVHQFKDGHKYCYVFPKENNRSEFGIEVSDVPLEIVGDFVSIEQSNDLYIVCCIITLFIGVIFLLSFFTELDDISWELEDIIIDTLHNDVKTHLEDIGSDKFYYYTIDDKLVATSKNEFITYMKSKINEYYKHPNMFPKFTGTKQEIRNDKLENLLNN